MSGLTRQNQHGDLVTAYPPNLAAITPSDSADVLADGGPVTVFVGGGGTVKVTTVGGQTVTVAVPTGGFVPAQVVRVHATSTTATGLLAAY